MCVHICIVDVIIDIIITQYCGYLGLPGQMGEEWEGKKKLQ